MLFYGIGFNEPSLQVDISAQKTVIETKGDMLMVNETKRCLSWKILGGRGVPI